MLDTREGSKMVQAKHRTGKFAWVAVCLISMTILIACEQQSDPTIISTTLPTMTSIERSTPETLMDSATTTELMPTLAGVVFEHDASLWQISQNGRPVKLLDNLPNNNIHYGYHYGEVSWDSKVVGSTKSSG